MYKLGVVSAVEPDTCRARVKFPAKGDIESYWLEVLVPDTATDKDYHLPTIGAVVAVLLDDREESGCILGAVYNATNKPPSPSATVRRVTFGDGTVIEYDRATHKLHVSTVGVVELTTTGNVQVTTEANVTLNAVDVAVTASGNVTVQAASASVTADSATVTADAINLEGATKVAGGAEAVALAIKTATALTTLKGAIAGGVPVPLDGGASLKTSIMAALAAWPPDIASTKLTSD